MTKLPHPNWNVTGVDGPKYKVGPSCANPSCSRWADHAHHVWRRSFIGGDYAWVRLWNGRTVANLVPLCHICHGEVTENKVTIVFEEATGLFFWERDGSPSRLSYQPPRAGEIEQEQHVHADPEVCPTCRRPTRQKVKLAPGEKRPKQRLVVLAPVDERENGIAVLEDLLTQAKVLLGRDEEKSHYYTLADALYYFVSSYPVELDADVKGFA